MHEWQPRFQGLFLDLENGKRPWERRWHGWEKKVVTSDEEAKISLLVIEILSWAS